MMIRTGACWSSEKGSFFLCYNNGKKERKESELVTMLKFENQNIEFKQEYVRNQSSLLSQR